jgi:hypothetical protein
MYDVVIIDAFNDLSVPYHLTTREATSALQRLMRPGGVLAANVIDRFDEGRFLASYVRTLQSVFGDGRAAIVLEDPEDMDLEQSTFVPVASREDVAAAFDRFHVIDGLALANHLARSEPVVLTDDYVPVDDMLAPLFAARFVDEVD